MSGKQACKYYIYSDIGREEKILKEQRKTQLILFCEESTEMRVRRWGVMYMTNKSTIFYMPIYDCRELAKKKKKKEVEWTEKAEIRKAEFLAAGEACQVMF